MNCCMANTVENTTRPKGQASIGRQEVLEGRMPVIMLFQYGVMKQSLMKLSKFCLDRLIKRNGWLDVAKAPKTSRIMVCCSWLFLYYGHLYASFLAGKPAAGRQKYQKSCNILAPLQEKDVHGGFYLYDYHQQYGTAMALLGLKRCLH